jgi:hypothetical protein
MTKLAKLTGTRPVHASERGITGDALLDNEATHLFDWGMADSEVPRCWNCDSRFGSASASWPCGWPVPRTNF